jgi:hypothetical protein
MRWPVLSHRFARAHLEHLGWTMCGQGDWAYAYRSPSGCLLARVSPFEPGYKYFVELCERCTANRYVPRIELASQLEGGGHLAVLEYLHSPDRTLVEGFLWQWEHPEEADADLRALRREVSRIDAWGRENLHGWVGIDIGPRHILLSSDGNPKVIDLFGVDLRTFLVNNPPAFARRVPPDQCKYVLDIPDLQDDDHTSDYLRRIRAALAAAAAASEPSNSEPERPGE